jgi:hypothetical protein
MMIFNDWFVYNKINNQKSIAQGLDNEISLECISESLRMFWLRYFSKLSYDEQAYYKLKYTIYSHK